MTQGAQFHALRVAKIHREIDGQATSIEFDIPAALGSHFQWRAGQHLTLRFDLEGQEHRRCYTISNPPGTVLRITVKRVSGGAVSNHIADAISVGDTVLAAPPQGRFYLDPFPLERRTHYLFGAGSGITPLYAMITTLLRDAPHSMAHLIYGNRSQSDILFLEQLQKLAELHPDRFTLRHVLSQPSLWDGLNYWRKGRLDTEAVAQAIAETPPIAQDVQYWLCGPGQMNADLREALGNLDVPTSRIHQEAFQSLPPDQSHVAGCAAQMTVVLDGIETAVSVAADQTLLDAMRLAGLSPPYSCQAGVCGACTAQLTQGEVQMRAHMALDETALHAGQILTCQSVAQSQTITIRVDP